MAKPHKPDSTGEKYPGSEYTADEVEFLMAMERYKRNRPFPTQIEVLNVLKSLGYRKVSEERATDEHRVKSDQTKTEF